MSTQGSFQAPSVWELASREPKGPREHTALTHFLGDCEGCTTLPTACEKDAAASRSRSARKESVRAGALSLFRLVRSFRHIIHRIVTGCALACKKCIKTSHLRHPAYTSAMSPMRHDAPATLGNADSYQSLIRISA